MLRIDGHTHTQFCPHGSGDHVENMIERAIELGFEKYHITEHTPVPDRFMNLLEPKKELLGNLHMPETEVDRYLKEMLTIKEKYKSRIAIKVGFEVDYIPTEVAWTKNFLQEYGKYCDTGILSVHYMEGLKDWRCIDYQPEDVIDELIPKYGSLENYQKAYYRLVQESIDADLGEYKPHRIGHLALADKFQQAVGVANKDVINKQVKELLAQIRAGGYSLDYNFAGLRKPLYKDTYPPSYIVEMAEKMGIQLIYGSDAHGVEDIVG